MKYGILQTSLYKRELKRAVKRGCDVDKLKEIIVLLADGEPLPARNRDHELSGKFKGFRECHIESDWLLV